MSTLPFNPIDPPDDPPPSVVQVTLWRLAVLLFREHVAASEGGMAAGARCAACDEAWPCRRRRLAEHALVTLSRPAASRPGRNPAYLDLLRDRELHDNADKRDVP